MKIFGIAGWSGSGKTTLIVALLAELRRRGVTVSTIKRTHHRIEVDEPGEDSRLLREAGAAEVLVASSRRFAVIHELRDEPEPRLAEAVRHIGPVDLLLVEGFKRNPHDKLEVHRPEIGKPLLCPDDPHVVAVATVLPAPPLPVPTIDLDDIPAIAEFILAHTGLRAA